MSTAGVDVPRQLSQTMLKAIDLYLDDLYSEGKTIQAGQSLMTGEMKRTQVRGLENMIVSTGRFSEIINYIKNQAGKRGGGPWGASGPLLISQLEELELKAGEIAGEDEVARLEIKLRLARGWARQVVAHYLYGQLVEGEGR